MSWIADNPAQGYGASREQPAQNSRGWSQSIPSVLPNASQQLQAFTSGGIPIIQHNSAAAGILQFQFVGSDAEAPPLLPAIELELRQGVDTGATVWRVYVGRVGVAVPVAAGFILANVVRTRGPGGQLSAQLRHGIASDMDLTRYERVQVGVLSIPLPLGTNRWTAEVGPGVTVIVGTGKSTTPVGPGPATVSGIVANDASFVVTNAGPGDVDVLLRFSVNC